LAVAVAGLVASCTTPGSPNASSRPATTTSVSPTISLSPPASSEGTPGWKISHPGPEHAIEGFANRTSVLPGEDVRLFISTTAGNYTVTAYRFGAYRNSAAQRVWQSATQAGSTQPAATVVALTNTVIAPWQPSLTVNTAGWEPGNYLFRLTLGHDEYWSTTMRQHATQARDRGVNLAFLGGNEVYRHIRFDSTAIGPNRLEIDYKSFDEDPYSKTNPAEATPEWRSPPFPRPESVLLGNHYRCNPAHADLVVANADNWLLRGIVHNGQRLPGLVGDEYARVDLTVPTPRPIEVLFHSPLTCRGRRDFADVTYYTTHSGAAVFSAGTQYWICALAPDCGHSNRDAQAHQAITAITTRLLQAFAAGPAGAAHPAADNLAAIGVPGADPNPPPTLPRDNSPGP
jgi:N,N-dimethylformamidase beta subunit-like protein